MPVRPMTILRPLAAAATALAAGSDALAAFPGLFGDEPSPYYLGVTESVTHDANVYRIPGGPSDTYFSSGLVAGFDQSIGRQHFAGAGNIRYNNYRRDSSQNNVSYGLNLGWDWSTIERFSGYTNVSANQSLATYNGNATLPTTNRNILRTDQISTGVRYGGYGRFSLGADYSHSRVNYSAPEYFASQSSGDSLGGNLYYNLNPDTTLGVGYRVTRTDSPYGILVGPGVYDSFSSRGRNIDFSASYRYTAQTNFSGRLSFTRQSNSGASGQDFSGVTGGLNANYAPTGKLSFNLAFARDAGTNGNFFNVPATQTGTTNPTTPSPTTSTTLGLYQFSQVTNSVTLGANYAATAKIGVNASYSYRQARFANTTTANGFTATGDSRDNLRLASLGANYAALRWLQLACSVSHESRNVSSTPAYAYSDNSISCSATASIR